MPDSSSKPDDDDNPGPHSLSKHQLAAATSPDMRLADIVGNFSDFDCLFEQLESPHVIELGKPLPAHHFLPARPVGTCPAAHNEALIGKLRRLLLR